MKNLNRIIIILLIFGLVLPSFGSINSPQVAFAQNQEIKAPETIEEARGWLERVWDIIKKNLPDILKKIWNEEVLPVWRKMYEWFRINIWQRVKSWLFPRAKEEIEKRKPIIKEEFKKEKEELKKEAPQVGKSLWERFKELIK